MTIAPHLPWQVVRRGVALESGVVMQISDTRARDREAVIRNIKHQVG